MVVLAASICTRGGKAVLSRQFREVNRSRIEGLLAAFPKLVDFGTQHTTVEQDNVRYVYQPLDELYMVLITNRQSNILQDIDSLHLFAQLVSSICKSLDEREILRHAYELMSAFDEVISLGYRENLSLSQIKTFLEMESHEERIQEIISRNKELEATEERKRKAKQLEMQRKELSRSNRASMPKAPSYSTYTPPPRAPSQSTYDSYEAEKNRTYKQPTSKGKGMQLGKKSKTTDMFERVRGDLGSTIEDTTPLVPAKQITVTENASPGQTGFKPDHDAIHVIIAETISARFDKDGTVKSLGVKGDLNLRISDPAFSRVKLDLLANASHSAQFKTHPNVDKAQFNTLKQIQLKDIAKSFPVNTPVGVLRWNANIPAAASAGVVPISFNVWVNQGGEGTFSLTVEYEMSGSDALRDVIVTIPYSTSEPSISSHDAVYEVSGDTVEWTIGTVDDTNPNGSFDLEAQAEDVAEFFPMTVHFSRTAPFVEVDVNSISLVEMDEPVSFSKDIRSIAENYIIEQH